MTAPRILELREWEKHELASHEIREETAQHLVAGYGSKIAVEPPTFLNDRKWYLTSEGWVGFIPVDETLHLSLKPKVQLDNLFSMLEYAYDVDFASKEDKSLFGANSLDEFYERLAHVLALRVLDRARRGFYRTYIKERERLPYLRGAFDIRAHLRRPWESTLACEFQEHTADIEENQILTWTLRRVVRSGACTERVLPTLRKAFRTVSSCATLSPFSPKACVRRLYNRLNEDYRPSHALCRFFLENTGPTHDLGDREMLPFLVNMHILFERFVARWLERHRVAGLGVLAQEHVNIGPHNDITFNIDLVLSNADTGRALAVLDTKYKAPDGPSAKDVQQVVAYAVAKNCGEAILVYPKELAKPLDEMVGDIRVRSAVFSLAGNLEENGTMFLSGLEHSTGVH
ncbi:MAG: McrC family protein [Acidimicrobiia bacterium]|nr:McrC family protein [Acidimicrobiia bacterium]